MSAEAEPKFTGNPLGYNSFRKCLIIFCTVLASSGEVAISLNWNWNSRILTPLNIALTLGLTINLLARVVAFLKDCNGINLLFTFAIASFNESVTPGERFLLVSPPPKNVSIKAVPSPLIASAAAPKPDMPPSIPANVEAPSTPNSAFVSYPTLSTKDILGGKYIVTVGSPFLGKKLVPDLTFEEDFLAVAASTSVSFLAAKFNEAASSAKAAVLAPPLPSAIIIN